MKTIPEFLRCPHCESSDLVASSELTPLSSPFDVTEGAVCSDCQREYPCVSGVWVLWSDDLKRLQLEAVETADHAALVKQANIKVYDKVAKDYSGHTLRCHLNYIAALREVARQYMAKPDESRRGLVIDVGCASGIGLDGCEKEFQNVVGVDISLNNLLPLPARGITAVLGDAEQLPFKAGSADLVTCFAAMHHFPSPEAFLSSSHACLRRDGVCLTGGDPSRAGMKLGPLARAVFYARRPLYRVMSKISTRFHLHSDTQYQQLNDLAECQRTNGGFGAEQLEQMFQSAGFEIRKVFYGERLEPKRFSIPSWKTFVLKALSFQNPLHHKNFASLSAVGRK